MRERALTSNATTQSNGVEVDWKDDKGRTARSANPRHCSGPKLKVLSRWGPLR